MAEEMWRSRKKVELEVGQLLAKGPEWTCPLTGKRCSSLCYCYVKPRSHHGFPAMPSKARLIEASCNNTMFTGEKQ